MANPGGTNQLGSHPYGAIKRATELTREAPMSGAPIATRATEAPRRAGKRARRGERAPAVAPPAPMPGPLPDPQAVVGEVWSALAADPDASDLIRQYAKGV